MSKPKQNKKKNTVYFRNIWYRNLNTKTNLILIKLLNFKVKRESSTHPNSKSKIAHNGEIGPDSAVTLRAENRFLSQSSERKQKNTTHSQSFSCESKQQPFWNIKDSRKFKAHGTFFRGGGIIHNYIQPINRFIIIIVININSEV